MRPPYLRSSLLLSALAVATALGCETPPASELDGGGGPPDGNGGGACSADVDCSDGLFCTGTERCAPTEEGADARGCVADPPECEVELCDEEGDRCVSTCPRPDADGDGHDAIACGGDDCDDTDALRFPGNVEVCDDVDDDCDPTTLGMVDRDADGYVSATCCNPQVDGARLCGSDCDDTASAINPMTTEICNGEDDDCDATTDEEAASTCELFGVMEVSCMAGRCAIGACEAGRADCDGMASTGCEVELAVDPMNCMTCGMRCMASGGTAICRDGACDVDSCAAGTHRCDPGTCVDDTSPLTCGSRCMPCFDPDSGTSTCTRPTGSLVYQCGIECDPGYAPVGGDCVEVEAVRPISPLSGTIVTTRRPTVHVAALPPGVDGFRAEACVGGPDCSSPIVVDLVGTSGVLADGATELPGGTVIFWRVRGRIGGDASGAASPWWHFWTRPTLTVRSVTTGLVSDFDADSYPDIAIGTSGGVFVARGQATGVPFQAPALVGATTSAYVYTAGDLDADGYIDALVQPSDTSRSCQVWRGSATGLVPSTSRVTGITNCLRAQPMGDTDGDGYADVALVDGTTIRILMGGASSFRAHDQTWTAPTYGRGVIAMEYAVGDSNGDGYGDMHVYTTTQVRRYNGGPTGVGATYDSFNLTGIFAATITGIAPGGDLNRDGYADIVTRVTTTFGASPRHYGWSGGSSMLTRATSFFAGADGTGAIGAPDVLGNAEGIDGFDDVLVTVSGEVRVWKGSPSGVESAGYTGSVTGTEARGTGPAGGDRQPAIVTRDSSSVVRVYVATRGAIAGTTQMFMMTGVLNLSAAMP